jgi:hypothetical protein
MTKHSLDEIACGLWVVERDVIGDGVKIAERGSVQINSAIAPCASWLQHEK